MKRALLIQLGLIPTAWYMLAPCVMLGVVEANCELITARDQALGSRKLAASADFACPL